MQPQFGWRHRGDHFRGGVFETMKTRAQEGRDPKTDEKMDADGKANAVEDGKRDVWMRL